MSDHDIDWKRHDAGRERGLPSPADIADARDDMPTPEEWRKLKAEWTHDYGLRRMEDREVKYEDEVNHGSEDQQLPKPDAEEKLLASPGEIVSETQPSLPDTGPDRGRGR